MKLSSLIDLEHPDRVAAHSGFERTLAYLANAFPCQLLNNFILSRMVVESASSMKPVLTTDSTDGTDSVAVLFDRENCEWS